MTRKIALAADHAGYEEKEKLKKTLDEMGVEYDDLGTNSAESVDYPEFARRVAEGVSSGTYDQGLLVCGSGTGMAIAANKVPGVRAAVAWNEEIARLARQHNDANVLSIGARMHPVTDALTFVDAFLAQPFNGGERHERRIEMLAAYEADGVLPPLP